MINKIVNAVHKAAEITAPITIEINPPPRILILAWADYTSTDLCTKTVANRGFTSDTIFARTANQSAEIPSSITIDVCPATVMGVTWIDHASADLCSKTTASGYFATHTVAALTAHQPAEVASAIT
ncbi:MAG: hypothetical protein ABW078_16045 [Sedimenticola sp.]